MANSDITHWRLFVFAAPLIAASALGFMVPTYLPTLFAADVGLGLSATADTFRSVSLLEIFVIPFLGLLVDGFPSRWGRRRHWVLVSAVLVAVTTSMLLIAGPGITTVYLAWWLLASQLALALFLVAHLSWGAELSSSYNEQTLVQAWRHVLEKVGVLSALAAGVVVSQIRPQGFYLTTAEGIGWPFIVALLIFVLIAILFVGERTDRNADTGGKGVRSTRSSRIGVLIRLLVAAFAIAIATGVIGSLVPHVATHVFKLPQSIGFAYLALLGGGLIFVPLVVGLSYRFGKHRTLTGLAIANAIGLPLFYVVPGSSVAMFGVWLGLFGVGLFGGIFLLNSMIADCAEQLRLETGKQRMGLYFALLLATTKLGLIMAFYATQAFILHLGFTPFQNNSQVALDSMMHALIGVPLLMYLVAAWVMWNFPTDREQQGEMRSTLPERSAPVRGDLYTDS
ncbi:MAG: MFS transporter [Candidatus Phaeomarinobacter sp.]